MFNDFDGDWGYEPDDYFREVMLERKEFRKTEKEKLQKVSDDVLLIKYEAEARHSEFLNEVVPGNNFPAFDVALKIKKNGWTMSPKQREALENVLAYYYSEK